MTETPPPVFAARPMSEVLSGHVERLIELYAGWSGYTPTRVQIQLFGDGSFCFGVLGKRPGKGRGYRVWSYDVIVARFSQVWPDGEIAWPADIPRVGPHQVVGFPTFAPKTKPSDDAGEAQPDAPAPALADD